MNNREFFNSVAFKWDGMCSHDDNKLKKIIGLSKVKPGSNILDIGTGTGILVSYLLDTEPEKVTAVDIS
jgi:demethylmenaquinone methyltransferase/2-methoxy-6-polyprenyl-1,4-benzoquinol methylase